MFLKTKQPLFSQIAPWEESIPGVDFHKNILTSEKISQPNWKNQKVKQVTRANLLSNRFKAKKDQQERFRIRNRQSIVRKVSINQLAQLPSKIPSIFSQIESETNQIQKNSNQLSKKQLEKAQMIKMLQKKSSPLIISALQTKPFFGSHKRNKTDNRRQKARSYDKIGISYQMYSVISSRSMMRVTENCTNLTTFQNQQDGPYFKNIKEFSQTKFKNVLKLPTVNFKPDFS